jgi:hypothetical protein
MGAHAWLCFLGGGAEDLVRNVHRTRSMKVRLVSCRHPAYGPRRVLRALATTLDLSPGADDDDLRTPRSSRVPRKLMVSVLLARVHPLMLDGPWRVCHCCRHVVLMLEPVGGLYGPRQVCKGVDAPLTQNRLGVQSGQTTPRSSRARCSRRSPKTTRRGSRRGQRPTCFAVFPSAGDASGPRPASDAPKLDLQPGGR